MSTPPYTNLDYSSGIVQGVETLDKFAHIRNVEADTPVSIRSSGGVWVPLTTAQTHNVVSTNAADTSAGTGARLILIEGLTADYEETSEIVTLNGITNVPTTTSFIAINNVVVAAVGSGNTNAGDITVTASIAGTVQNSIPAGYSLSQSLVYTVPAGKTLFVSRFFVAATRTQGSGAVLLTFQGRGKAPAGLEVVAFEISYDTNANNLLTLPDTTFRRVEEKTAIDTVVTSDTSNVFVSGGFSGFLKRVGT